MCLTPGEAGIGTLVREEASIPAGRVVRCVLVRTAVLAPFIHPYSGIRNRSGEERKYHSVGWACSRSPSFAPPLRWVPGALHLCFLEVQAHQEIAGGSSPRLTNTRGIPRAGVRMVSAWGHPRCRLTGEYWIATGSIVVRDHSKIRREFFFSFLHRHTTVQCHCRSLSLQITGAVGFQHWL